VVTGINVVIAGNTGAVVVAVVVGAEVTGQEQYFACWAPDGAVSYPQGVPEFWVYTPTVPCASAGSRHSQGGVQVTVVTGVAVGMAIVPAVV